MKLYQLIYVSKSSYPMSKDDLQEILKTAQENNDDQGISGLLVYDRGHFFQVLEGGYNDVETLFTQIQKDKRHSRVNRIVSSHIPERYFSEWGMGFYNLDEMAELDFFKLRKFMKSLHEVTSVEQKSKLAKYALQIFVDLKQKPVSAV